MAEWIDVQERLPENSGHWENYTVAHTPQDIDTPHMPHQSAQLRGVHLSQCVSRRRVCRNDMQIGNEKG